MNIVNEAYAYHQLSASANVSPHPANLGGIFVSSASDSPSITVYDDDGTGTDTKIVDTFTPVAGQFYPMPFAAIKGIYVVIAGTVSCTVGVMPT